MSLVQSHQERVGVVPESWANTYFPEPVVHRLLVFSSDRCILRNIILAFASTPLYDSSRKSPRVTALIRKIEALHSPPYIESTLHRYNLPTLYVYDDTGTLSKLECKRDYFAHAFFKRRTMWCSCCNRSYSASYWPTHATTHKHLKALDETTRRLQETLVWGEIIATPAAQAAPSTTPEPDHELTENIAAQRRLFGS